LTLPEGEVDSSDISLVRNNFTTEESKAYFLVGQNAEGGLQDLVDRLLGRE